MGSCHHVFALVALLGVFSSDAGAGKLPGPLVDTQWVQENRQSIKLLVARGDMQSYGAGHIPGAAFISFKNVRADSSEEGVLLQDMHLSQEAYEVLMRAGGINSGDAVVITHPGMEPGDLAIATYVYWQMKFYGHEEVALLDGGTAKWIKENRAVRSGDETITPGTIKVTSVKKALLATTADTKRAFETKSADIVDARPMGQFLGIDKRDYVDDFGHIPGAKVLPFDIFSPMGMGKGMPFPMKAAILRGVSALALSPEKPVITYCNTGHMASVDWFVLHELLDFKDVALFDGSMHAWTKHRLPTTLTVN